MTVLHLGAGNLYGGIETFLVTLARCRSLCPDMQPEYGLCFGGRLWEELKATGVPVHDLSPVRFSRPWTIWRARHRLKRVLAASRPAAVVTHGAWPHAIAAPVVRQTGAKLVAFAHSDTLGRHWLERWAARTPPDLVIANSQFTAAAVPNQFPRVPVAVCAYPVAAGSPVAADAVRTEVGTPPETVVILQASRLERWKGQAVLMAALGNLREVPGWECWLAGGVQKPDENEFLRELQTTATAAGIANRVRFLGQRSDVPRLMAAANVFCQPNTGPEPFGIVFVEALRAGLPVVTSAFGGGAEIVTPACGILTPPGDAAALATALAELIRDPERRRALGAAGPARADAVSDPARQLHRFAELVHP